MLIRKEKPTAIEFDIESFLEKLPAFYYTGRLHETKSCIVNFEVNGLGLGETRYDVYIKLLDKTVEQITADRKVWVDTDNSGYQIVLSAHYIRGGCLTVYFKMCDEKALPKGQVLLVETGREISECNIIVFDEYKRETELSLRPTYRKWEEVLKTVENTALSTSALHDMRSEMLAYSVSRQVMDSGDLHYGAIYSDEDKYSFRDAACASLGFMQEYGRNGNADWKLRARLALDYAYKGQQHSDNPEIDGGIGEMGMLGTDGTYRRIYHAPSPISGVDTGIIACHAVRAIEAGLETTTTDIEALRGIANWFINNEFEFGGFKHHQDATHDCLNSNIIGGAALLCIARFMKSAGENVPSEWRSAAGRAMLHTLPAQEAIGEWPYVFARIGRGQKYHWQSIPDNGMLATHLLYYLEDEEFRDTIEKSGCFERLAYWYLLTSRFESGDSLMLDYEENPGIELGFSCFTWCRFTECAVIARVAEKIGNTIFWRKYVVNQLKYIQKLLYAPNSEKAPLKPSIIPLKLHSWIQALEWNTVLLNDALCDIEKQ